MVFVSSFHYSLIQTPDTGGPDSTRGIIGALFIIRLITSSGSLFYASAAAAVS